MSETQKAQSAEAGGETIFGKILCGDIRTDFIYRDDLCAVFKDIAPAAPVHLLVVPIKPIQRLADAKDEDKELLGHMLLVARKVAKDQGLEEGYRLVINDGKHGGQTVFHLHFHVFGGRQLEWPPG